VGKAVRDYGEFVLQLAVGTFLIKAVIALNDLSTLHKGAGGQCRAKHIFDLYPRHHSLWHPVFD
jgi:hypothetical protein